jgi:hypothetical protein
MTPGNAVGCSGSSPRRWPGAWTATLSCVRRRAYDDRLPDRFKTLCPHGWERHVSRQMRDGAHAQRPAPLPSCRPRLDDHRKRSAAGLPGSTRRIVAGTNPRPAALTALPAHLPATGHRRRPARHRSAWSSQSHSDERTAPIVHCAREVAMVGAKIAGSSATCLTWSSFLETLPSAALSSYGGPSTPAVTR